MLNNYPACVWLLHAGLQFTDHVIPILGSLIRPESRNTLRKMFFF